MHMTASIPNEKIDLTGQVAIVTGGGRGIGRAIALALAKAGAKVAVAARSEDQLAETVALIEEVDGQGLAIPTDVTDQQAVEGMVTKTEQQLGPVTLLVNNAGIPGPGGPMWETDPKEWWQCIDVNLRGPYLCSRAVLPGMVERRQGRIVTVASGTGVGGFPYIDAYNISKCATIRLSELLAVETKEYDISVFAIHPGFVHTAMVDKGVDSGLDEKWFGSWFSRNLAAGHDISAQCAADLVCFLASGNADALSGCFLGVRDDVNMMVQRAEEIREQQLYTLRLRT
jgi:NAD(P)-dependent dehydrogenase (short-subunit alcohol dehydrogenase family)